jgi:hypothetical protein
MANHQTIADQRQKLPQAIGYGRCASEIGIADIVDRGRFGRDRLAGIASSILPLTSGTAPISIIRAVFVSSPVVSRSTTMASTAISGTARVRSGMAGSRQSPRSAGQAADRRHRHRARSGNHRFGQRRQIRPAASLRR